MKNKLQNLIDFMKANNYKSFFCQSEFMYHTKVFMQNDKYAFTLQTMDSCYRTTNTNRATGICESIRHSTVDEAIEHIKTLI